MLNKKITNVLALNEFAPEAHGRTCGQRGSKCFIGFTDEADFRVSVNMNAPIKELVNKTH
ncbi:hypothetical protein [Photorhabdus asymbiotica]|uniref:hypothetical protein n=1 Tax=Photorhabdus asymbiotica TaxID=291112 RepID=UPI003DA7379F